MLKIVTTDSDRNAFITNGVTKVTQSPKSKPGQKNYGTVDARVKHLGNIPGTGIVFVCNDAKILDYVNDIFATRDKVSKTITTNKSKYEQASCTFWMCWGGSQFVYTTESYDSILRRLK